MTTLAGWYAYSSSRGTARTHPRRHAVHEMAHLCGALDVECDNPRARAVALLGAWDPDHPDNCMACVLAVALAVTRAAEDDEVPDHEWEPV